jgi:hypothetical protein
MIAELDSIPVFAASAPMSSITASICAAMISGLSSKIALTPFVFCAVIAVITDVP